MRKSNEVLKEFHLPCVYTHAPPGCVWALVRRPLCAVLMTFYRPSCTVKSNFGSPKPLPGELSRSLQVDPDYILSEKDNGKDGFYRNVWSSKGIYAVKAVDFMFCLKFQGVTLKMGQEGPQSCKNTFYLNNKNNIYAIPPWPLQTNPVHSGTRAEWDMTISWHAAH